jgi:hypothetical protein
MSEGESSKKTKGSTKTAAKSRKGTVAETVETTLVEAPAPRKRTAKKVDAIVPAEPKVRKTKAAKVVEAATAPVPQAPALVATTIVAKVDVGFGNALYIRGTGPGLSWQKGLPMRNTGADKWEWSSVEVSAPFQAKVLINDSIWSLDADTEVAPGNSLLIEPSF